MTAVLMLLSSFSGWAAVAAPVVSTTVQAAPSPVEAGSSTAINVNVSSQEAVNVLVDVEIFNSSLQKVHQMFTDNIAVAADSTATVPFTWNVPGTLPAGEYIVSVGIFGAGWSGMHEWLAGAARIQVSGTTNPPTGLPAPANLKATPIAASSIQLSWDGIPSATSYDIEADGVLIGNVAAPAYTYDGLAPNTEHSYRVRAKNADVTGPWSPVVTAATLAAGVQAGLKVQVKTGTSAKSQMIVPEIEIYNVSDAPINLGDVKARYYFTIDGEKPLSIGFWSTVNKPYVQTRFVKMPIPSAQADYYLEIGFAPEAGVLQPNAKAGVYTWINKSDWSSFDQTDDYSFNASANSTENAKAPGYRSGTLVWGQEPTLLDMPAAPSNIQGESADTTIRLTWEPVADATGYDVDADGTVIENVDEPAYLDKWLNPGTRHTYKVRSRKGATTGIWSSAATFKTTGEQNLPAPVNVRGTTTENSIAISWSALEEEITGYDVEVDGNVIDAGTSTSYNHGGLAAGTKHTYRVRAKDGATLGKWSAPLTTNTVFTPTGEFDVSFTVDTSAGRKSISPYIYGTNDDLTGTEKWGSRRIGGNRLSTYNWENNASNAGSDYFHNSDSYIPWYYGGVPWGGNMEEPGVGIAGFHRQSLAQGAYTLATLPMAGFAAKDKDGAVSANETAPSSRWVAVKPAKNAPFSLTPDLTDDAVYQDEFVNLMVNQFGDASTETGIKGYELDNEPSLWHDTHPYMHPEEPGAAEVLNKGIDLAKAVKNVDPYAQIYGPVSYSFDELYSMHAADDWDAMRGNYKWYIDYYLDKFRIASAQENKRLLDAVDFHWYPEISAGGYRITDSGSYGNLEANLARMQAPRSLWDPTYTENSWIGQWYSAFLPILPRMQQSIDQYNPGTKIAITEYNYGGEDNIYGGIAQADVLGIFGKSNVYLATFWKMVNHLENAPYISAAVKLFTNYDGNGGKFGDTSVLAETSNVENSSIYASVNQDGDDELHLILMNKNNDFDMNAVLNIAGGTAYTSARVFALDGSSAEITEKQGITGITGNSFTYKVPKLTVVHLVLKK